MGQQVITNTGQIKGAAPLTYRKITPRTVNTTVAATDLLNGEITVGAGALPATGVMRITMFGDWLQNSGGLAAPPRFQLVLGGTTLIDTGAGPGAALNLSASRGAWEASALVAANNATNAQNISWKHSVWASVTGSVSGTNGSVFTTGQGAYQGIATRANSSNTDSFMCAAAGFNTGTKDMTAAQTLVVNVINGSASATYETRLFNALIEII